MTTTQITETVRYQAAPSQVLDGYWTVVDTVTNRCPLIGADEEAALAKADILNRAAARRKVCKGCHHKRLAADIVGGQCSTCRGAK